MDNGFIYKRKPPKLTELDTSNYEHKSQWVAESETYKILGDFPIQTDLVLENNRPDLVVADKVHYICSIADVQAPLTYE